MQTDTVVESVGLDRVPHGTFFTELDPSQVAGIQFSVMLGHQLKEQHPEIADLYRRGKSLTELEQYLQLVTRFGIKPKTAQAALRYAICGYDGTLDVARHDAYLGLIPDPNERREIAKAHNRDSSRIQGLKNKENKVGFFSITTEERREIGRKSGLKQYREGIGIHAQTPEDHRRQGVWLATSQGHVPFSDEELQCLMDLATNPRFQRETQIHAQNISRELNRRFHEGSPVRNGRSVSKAFYRHKHRFLVE